VEAITSQHALHLADTLTREEANLAMGAKLEAQNAAIMEELRIAIELAKKKESVDPLVTQVAEITRPHPPLLAQAPVMPLFTMEGVLAQMQAASSAVVPSEQAAAVAAMMNAMMTTAFTPAIAAGPVAPTIPTATEPKAESRELIDDEKLAAEVASLNGGGKPGFPAKVSNRVNPLQS
jgi:hypothetical protein